MNAEHSARRTRIGPVIGIVVLIVVAFLVGRVSVPRVETEDMHEEHAEAEVWTCSMHPQVRQPEPGPCPICGMDLIPVRDDEDEESDDDVVRLRVSERAAALMNIQTWPAERRSVGIDLRLFGRVEYDESRLVNHVARSPGYVERLHANFTLQRVEAGDVIAEIYSPDVVAAMRELLVTRARGGDTQTAARARLVRMGVSYEQVNEVLETGDVPRVYRVTSPIDGVVKSVGAREGEWLREGDRVVQLADLSTVWIQLEAYETELSWVAPGQSVHFTTQAYPGESFEGEVVYVDPVLNEPTRTVRFRAEVPNPEGRLKPGLFVRGTLHAGHDAREPGDETPLVIPASAPLITGKRAIVYVKEPAADRPTFEPREVVLGPRAGDYYVVRDGLEEGDLVVVHGQFKIDSELQIRGRPSMMAPDGGRPPLHDHGPAEHEQAEMEKGSEVSGIGSWEGEVDEAFSRQIASLLESYLTLSDAMASDDFDASMAALREMHDRLLEVDGGLIENEARSVWQEIEAALHRPRHAMVETENLEELRKPFESLTRAMIHAVESFGGKPVSEVYVMNCPMAFDSEGADWLQTDDEVRNPYFGAAMLRCGEVRRRI